MRAIVFFVELDNKISCESRIVRDAGLFIRRVFQVLVIDTIQIGEIECSQGHPDGGIMGTIENKFWACASDYIFHIIDYGLKQSSGCGLVLFGLIKQAYVHGGLFYVPYIIV